MTPGHDFEQARLLIRDALAAREARPLQVPGFRLAAVLVPLLARPRGPTVLFTRRAESLPHHKGEISFPGGAREPGESAEAAALREAEEEVGLDRASVEVLGTLDDVPSIAGFVVTPVAAAVRDPPESFRFAELEVREPFEIPLAALLEPGSRRSTVRKRPPLPREVEAALVGLIRGEEAAGAGLWRSWSFHADAERIVWGLTARVLADLLDRAFKR